MTWHPLINMCDHCMCAISSVLRQKVLSRILETFQEKQKTDFSGKERRLVKTNNTEL
jgi:hypothetical protein